MAFRAYNLYRYTIPMVSNRILRGRELPVREGLLVRVQCHENEGWGEIAPLPEFSHETLEMAEKQTALWLKQWDKTRGQNQMLSLDGLYPSVAFGLSCAFAEMKVRLNSQGNFQTVPLCFDAEQLSKTTQLAKLKIGSPCLSSPQQDGVQVNQFFQQNAHTCLRLDANRRWTLTQALQFADQISPEYRQRIAFIEEPCNTPKESLEFARLSQISIAWDETLREPDFYLKAEQGLTAIVIKPTLVGSIETCTQLIAQAHQLGLQAVFSSSIESSLGLTQLARLSAQYTPESIPGLDTLNLMTKQLIRPVPSSPLPILSLADITQIL